MRAWSSRAWRTTGIRTGCRHRFPLAVRCTTSVPIPDAVIGVVPEGLPEVVKQDSDNGPDLSGAPGPVDLSPESLAIMTQLEALIKGLNDHLDDPSGAFGTFFSLSPSPSSS